MSPASPVIHPVAIRLPRLPACFDRLGVAVLADLHAAPGRTGEAHVTAAVRTVNSAKPDLVVLLGDTVHCAEHAHRYVPLLADLRARHGVWATLGNHEHGFIWYSRFRPHSSTLSIEEWRRLYREAGIRLLVNEAHALEKDGARLWLVGVDDAYSGHDDLPAALAGVDANEASIIFTHSPDLLDRPRVLEADLTLAGHTHGGQVRLPFLGPLWAPCRNPRQRSAGLITVNGATAYVSRGLGEGFPLRFRCPREMPLLTLRATSAT